MFKPKSRERGHLIRELADETLVYCQDNHQAHCLNRTAALVWRHCDGRTSVAGLARKLSQELGVTVEECVVEAALDQLQQADLLEASAPVGRRFSRREMAVKLGAAMLLAPAVLSIMAPKAMAQASTTTPDASGNPGNDQQNDTGDLGLATDFGDGQSGDASE